MLPIPSSNTAKSNPSHDSPSPMPNTESNHNQHQNYIDVISIGTLYDPNDRWHKKYWSSSRGRERYPYPVGYEATRTYNGINSTIQILQGDTGPIFQITSVDGHTASGPTPDIAWKKFQRESSPLAKSIGTKRLSASIDGPEFFGFKYHTVQQLLRQLVIAAASQGTYVSNTHQNNKFPKQRVISSASNDCSQDKGAEKRKVDCMESISDNKPKKVRLLKDTNLSTSNRDNDLCKYINGLPTAAPASADLAQPHPIQRQKMDGEKICSLLAANMRDDDAPTAEGSLAKLSQDGKISFSNPTMLQTHDCDLGFEEVTMSMMKLLLPQAVPFLRKARGTKKKTADVDGMNTGSICEDHSKTLQALESYKGINNDSFNTKFEEHNDMEKLVVVQDSCEELDENACIRDSYDELDNNAYVPDSCDELDKNVYPPNPYNELDDNGCVPDSCDEPVDNFSPDICVERDKNAYAPDSCDELDENAQVLDPCDKLKENAQVPDSCDEPDEKEIVPDSPQHLNENNYVSDLSVKLDGNLSVPNSCENLDETENISILAELHTRVDVKICEGTAVPRSLESEKNLSAKYGDIHEANKETLNPVIFFKEGFCGSRFCKEEGNIKDYLKHQGPFNLATQQQIENTNQSSHMGISNASTDELHGVIRPVFSNGCQTDLDKCAFEANPNAEAYGPRTLDGQYAKLCTVTENENGSSCFEKFPELSEWDMVTDEEFLMCEKMASSMIKGLNHKQLKSVHDSNETTGCTALAGNKSMLITATECENKLSGFGKLIGLYEHPKPVLSVLICTKGTETYICTSCGTSEDKQRTLFMYTLKVEGESTACPYFVGHSRMLLPDAKCFFGRQIALDKSGMQLTPSGQNLVLLKGMQLPSCRNRVLQCQCLECQTHSREENGVKIVQLNDGYITVLAELKTVHRVLCLLVCEPNYLVAVEANGAFRFWTMNSTWRYVTKEFILPPTDCISPCAIELKQIPNCPHLVVGHNCLGEFGLWDVSRHAIISRFYTPDSAVFRFIPLGLYQTSRKDKTFTCLKTNEQPNSLKNKSTLRSSQSSTNINLDLVGANDVVISILVATCPDIKSSYRPMPDGCWKLGMLMNNKVVLKYSHTLDARAVTVAALGDYGVLGTNQGYLHVWDLYTGLKLGASLCFKDGRVECLYTDNARSGLLAVADDRGKLLLYSGGDKRQTLQTSCL